MNFKAIDAAAIAGSLAVLATVVALIVRGRLKPRYALLWLVASTALLVTSVWRGLIDRLGDLFGVDYKPSLLFLALDLFLMLILLHMSVVVSRLTDRVRDLAQELALLRDGGDGLRTGGDGGPPDTASED